MGTTHPGKVVETRTPSQNPPSRVRLLDPSVIGAIDERIFHSPQSYLELRNSMARAGVVIIASLVGLLGPASTTNTETEGFSASRPATTFPAVPPMT
ncbi:MAG: hypothetical protein Q9167_005270 [Letrouitia subvulpina]